MGGIGSGRIEHVRTLVEVCCCWPCLVAAAVVRLRIWHWHTVCGRVGLVSVVWLLDLCPAPSHCLKLLDLENATAVD